MITVATTTGHYQPGDTTAELARLTLAAGVPIEIEHLRAAGGPNDYQMDAAHDYIQQQRLGESILFVTKGETGNAMRILIEICAILAFCPGGITVLGLHFAAERQARP